MITSTHDVASTLILGLVGIVLKVMFSLRLGMA